MTTTIIRVAKNRNHSYVMLDRRLAEDRSLSWKAKGLTTCMLNHRYNRQLPTLLIFNGKPDDLSPRIASRVSGRDLATVLPMYGDDHRRRTDRAPIFRG